jgi:alpha-L-fucosidase 2
MYAEGSPVFETPPSGAQSLHDMLLSGRDGLIRIFPAIPGAWPDVTIHDLRTEGAFLVSAVRRDRQTQFVRIKSLAGEPCRLAPGLPGPYDVRSTRAGSVHWQDLGDGTLRIRLDAGDEVIIVTKGTEPDLTIAPVPTSGTGHVWGLPPG